MSLRRFSAVALSVVALFTSTACYHAVVDTGRSPSPQVIDRPWAMSYIAGLVPPPVAETASQCPGGVAKVETQHSVPNMLVSFVTFSLVSPMHVRVTCAAGGAASAGAPSVTSSAATVEGKAAALNEAGRIAGEQGQAVYVRF
jgi:hypothetical protein